MTEAKTEKQEAKKRERSPMYPVINLGEAVSKVKALYEKEGKNYTPRGTAAKAMGYNSLSGRALQLLSSIYQYGLFERKKGEVKISNEAFIILHAPENSPEQLKTLAECSLKPSIFGLLYDAYPDSLPSDETLIWYLRKKDFSEEAAKTITQCYKETIEFANPKEHKTTIGEESNNLHKTNQGTTAEEIEIRAAMGGQKKDVQNSNAIAWTFPIGEKTASLTIIGGRPSQEEMDSLITILEAFKKTLPNRPPVSS
ncbi:MAG: hypothetical protein NTW55_02635 [Planctomycetota bacterium]|nr:hypothetical protein [Planctomycetota bacterium]